MMDYYSILMNLSLETSTSSTTVRGDYALNQRYQVKTKMYKIKVSTGRKDSFFCPQNFFVLKLVINLLLMLCVLWVWGGGVDV